MQAFAEIKFEKEIWVGCCIIGKKCYIIQL